MSRVRPADGALCHLLAPSAGAQKKTRRSETSAFSSALRSCLHPSWRSPRILSTPLRRFHSFSTPTWHAAFAGRGEEKKRAADSGSSLRCGFSTRLRVLDRAGWTAGELCSATQRRRQTTIDYKTVCCSSSCKVKESVWGSLRPLWSDRILVVCL